MNPGCPLSRQCEIPWRFAALGMLSVSHIMPVLVLNTSMDANITIYSFRQLFPDKIFSLTLPWLLVKSLTFRLTAIKFPDISSCSRQVVTLEPGLANYPHDFPTLHDINLCIVNSRKVKTVDVSLVPSHQVFIRRPFYLVSDIQAISLPRVLNSTYLGCFLAASWTYVCDSWWDGMALLVA